MSSTANGHWGVFDVEVIDVLDDYVMTEIHRGVYVARRTTSTQRYWSVDWSDAV